MTFTFERFGFAAAFFLGSFGFFLSAPASAGAFLPCFSAASACSRNSRMFRVRLAMNARHLLNIGNPPGVEPLIIAMVRRSGYCGDAAVAGCQHQLHAEGGRQLTDDRVASIFSRQSRINGAFMLPANYQIRLMERPDYEAIVEICRLVYPTENPYTHDELEDHRL